MEQSFELFRSFAVPIAASLVVAVIAIPYASDGVHTVLAA